MSNPGKLVLDECELKLESLQRIIGSISDLQEFSYDHKNRWGYDKIRGVKYGPVPFPLGQHEKKEIVQSLLQSASHSLTSLDLTEHWDRTDDKEGHYMGSLRGFQVLKRIRVEYRMFVESGPKSSAFSARTRRMVDVIPVSLESMTLIRTILDTESIAKFL